MSGYAGVPVVLAAGQLTTGKGWYRGITVAETAGSAATVKLFDNTSGSGTLLGTYKLNGAAANASLDVYFAGDSGVQVVNGIFAVITGTVEGSIRV